MIRKCSRVALAATALVLVAGSPAGAQEIPTESVFVHLKDQPELSLAATGDGAELSSEGGQWSLRPVEAIQRLGDHQIVEESSGQCLDAAELAEGETTAPVALADCAGATEWAVLYDDEGEHWLLATVDGLFLGIDRSTEDTEGTEVVVVDVPSKFEAEPWHFSALPDEEPPTSQPPTSEPPTSQPPSEEPPSETTEPPAAQPKLPQTGAGLVLGGGAALVAVGAGAGLLMWRRRALRDQW